MPTYDYRCPTCQRTTTINQPINEPAPGATCDNCRIPMIRNYTAPGVTFRGTGWGKDR